MSHGFLGSHAKDKPPTRLPPAQRFAGVRLTLVEARGLASKDSNGSGDPYVEVWVDANPNPNPNPTPNPIPNPTPTPNPNPNPNLTLTLINVEVWVDDRVWRSSVKQVQYPG